MIPTLPVSNEGKSVSSFSEGSGTNIMRNIAYLNRKTGMSHDQLLSLPHGVFLAYLKEHFIMDCMETEGGREFLAKVERVKVTSPDFTKLRQLAGYSQQEGGENK